MQNLNQGGIWPAIRKHETMTVKELNDKIKFETVVVSELLSQYLPALVDEIEFDQRESVDEIREEFEDRMDRADEFMDMLADEIDNITTNGDLDLTSKSSLMSLHQQILNRKF